jgi:hypothetical protein
MQQSFESTDRHDQIRQHALGRLERKVLWCGFAEAREVARFFEDARKTLALESRLQACKRAASEVSSLIIFRGALS